MSKEEQENNNIDYHLSSMIRKTGIEGPVSLVPMAGGGNNRVFQLGIGGKKFFLKSYFRSEKDPRDRLGTENSFIMFAWEQGLRSVPKSIAFDRSHFLGIYEFVDGRKLAPGEVTEDFVQQALSFYRNVNRNKNEAAAVSLPTASEACFSISDHISLVGRRVGRLDEIDGDDRLAKEAREFVYNELHPSWERIENNVRRQCRYLGLEVDHYIVSEDRCLSPSDFGFHNAILKEDGTLVFIDFEYAGWDDPAKMVCDFFCQPAVPVPIEYYQDFLSGVQSGLTNPEVFRHRVDILLPVYKIKWCCIMLNEFMPVDRERRDYAVNYKEGREIQLYKARKALSGCG